MTGDKKAVVYQNSIFMVVVSLLFFILLAYKS